VSVTRPALCCPIRTQSGLNRPLSLFGRYWRSLRRGSEAAHAQGISGLAHLTGEDCLDTVAIMVAFLIATAQALTILLTIRQERDIKELGRLVDGQRLLIVQLKAQLARRNIGQPRLAKSEREPTSPRAALKRAAPSQPEKTPKGLPNTEDGLERTTNVINWLNGVAIDKRGRSIGRR
jgi:hypothetical protein